MQALIDSTVKLRQLHDKQTPASVNVICEHLKDVYNAVQHENNQRDKSYSGIRARVISTTVNLLCDVYQSYLLNIEILNSKFFILVRDVIARSFNETPHELVSDDERRLLKPVCDIVLKIADSMTPELANCDMISLFFGKTFVVSMTEALKAFASGKVSYGAEQKATIIKAILNMFSRYCVAKGDEAVSNGHVASLVNAALCCVSSSIYFRIFDHQLQQTHQSKSLKPQSELFLDVCPRYVISFVQARREPMFTEAKNLVVKTAPHILHQFTSQLNQIPSYLIESTCLLVELLLLFPSESFHPMSSLIKDLLNIVQQSANNSTMTKETKKLTQQSISLIYTLTNDTNLRETISKSLSEDGKIELFDQLSTTSSDKHIRFTSVLISWTMNKENMANRKYSPEMIKTFVQYMSKCEEDPLQQCKGVPLDSMITTLTGLVENEDAQKELVKQDAVPVIVKCASETQFDVSTVQQPSLECLWTMAFTEDALKKLVESPKFLAHLKMVRKTTTVTCHEQSSEELARAADGLLWKLEKEPVLLKKQKTSDNKFEYDIMISYQRKDQNICEELYKRLTHENKFRVWFDEQNIYGPIMTRMAEGIEKSEFILIAMSEPYQKSQYCRSEAMYAYNTKRTIIPLKLHGNFKATGWLGITVGDLLYVDFSGKQSNNVAYNELVEQIARYRQPEVSEPPKREPEQIEIPQTPVQEEDMNVTQEEQPSSLQTVEPGRPSIFRRIKNYVKDRTKYGRSNRINVSRSNGLATSRASSVVTLLDNTSKQYPSTTTDIFAGKQMENWTCDEVEHFLHEYQFEKFSQILSKANGNSLFRLYSMSQDNGIKLLEYMKEENPEIKLSDYLRFTQSIEDYVKQTNTNN